MGRPLLHPDEVPTLLETGAAGLPQGTLEVEGERLEVAAAGMGNPHVVIPVASVAAVDLDRLGPALETHPQFPARTNVHFVEVLTPSHLVMRVWERGAGPTLACGTGACATQVVCHCLGLCADQVRVDLPGGPLTIAWDGSPSSSVWMTGPAEAVFDGMVTPELWGVADLPPAGSEGAETTESQPAENQAAESQAAESQAAESQAAEIVDCASVCVNGCIRPDACPSSEARARAMALLQRSSLDDLVNLASDSLEARTRARAARGL
jgi:diaminopimelate epimerase